MTSSLITILPQLGFFTWIQMRFGRVSYCWTSPLFNMLVLVQVRPFAWRGMENVSKCVRVKARDTDLYPHWNVLKSHLRYENRTCEVEVAEVCVLKSQMLFWNRRCVLKSQMRPELRRCDFRIAGTKLTSQLRSAAGLWHLLPNGEGYVFLSVGLCACVFVCL